MSFAQGDLDIAVLGPDDAGVVVGQIDTAGRQSDVVYQCGDFLRRDDPTNLIFHLRKPCRRFFDTGADGHSGMDQDLATVNSREEVATQHGDQPKRDQYDEHESERKHPRCLECTGQNSLIAISDRSEATLKTSLEEHKWIAGVGL